MKKHLKRLGHFLFYQYLILFDKEVKKHRINSKTIAIIIINYNQLENLRYLVSFLLDRDFKNIVIIDNNSTYPPLLEYYDKIKGKIVIEMMSDNLGHMVFFENKTLLDKYGSGYYCITDADIRPNENLPDNFLDTLIQTLDKYQF